MIELIRQWITGVTCAAMLIAVAQTLVPVGAVKRVMNFTSGLLLITVIALPLFRIDGTDLSGYLMEYEIKFSQPNDQLREENEAMMKDIIATQCEVYLQNQAREIGLDCDFEVYCAMSEEGYPVPYVVHITGELTAEQQRTLILLIAQELGVPVERQYWNGGEHENA